MRLLNWRKVEQPLCRLDCWSKSRWSFWIEQMVSNKQWKRHKWIACFWWRIWRCLLCCSLPCYRNQKSRKKNFVHHGQSTSCSSETSHKSETGINCSSHWKQIEGCYHQRALSSFSQNVNAVRFHNSDWMDQVKQPTFIANLVAEILDASTVDEWHYIAVVKNPADLGTRWISFDDVAPSNWIQGPEWLKQPIVLEKDNQHPVEQDMYVNVFIAKDDSQNTLNWENFSQFIRLRRSFVDFVLEA